MGKQKNKNVVAKDILVKIVVEMLMEMLLEVLLEEEVRRKKHE